MVIRNQYSTLPYDRSKLTPQQAWKLRNPYQKKTIEIIVDGKKYVFNTPEGSSIAPGTRDLLKKLIQGVKKWKKNPTQENWIEIFRVSKPKLPGKPQQYRQLLFSEELRRVIQGRKLESGIAKGIFDQSDIKKLLNISEAEVSKIKTYTPESFVSTRGLIGSKAAALRTPVQKGTNDFPEIVKIFDKYKYNTNLTNFQNQDAVLDLMKKNSIITDRFKKLNEPLTFKNLKTRIARTHLAVIKNSLDKKNYPGIFEGLSLADRQNFLKTSQKTFSNIINRSLQSQLIDTLKGEELKLASDKLSKFTELKRFIGKRLPEIGGRHESFLQFDHPISLATLEKTGNLNQALRVTPIAGDINIWKARTLDQRLNALQRKGDVKGLRALNEINQALFGKGSPSFTATAGAEGISKIKGLPADFRKANVLKQLKENIGLHETLKENITKVPEAAWKTSGLDRATITGSLNQLKSWDPKVLTPLIEEWATKNPKFTKILEKRIGCQGGCLAATANESPALFSEALKKTPAAARSFLGMLGRGGLKAAPYAALAAAGAAIEPLVKFFRSDDPTTYLTDESQMKGMLLATIEGETPKVDEELLKWQYPGMAASAAAAIPGSSALMKARKAKGFGTPRAALGPVGKFLAGTFSPLGVAATLPISVAAQRKGGTEWGDIATDPLNWMAPAFASTGARMATRGMAPTGILSKAIRMGISPRTLSLVSRRFGMPGLAISAGIWGYDKWKNRSINDPED